MARRNIAAANWKMYKTESEARAFLQELASALPPGHAEIRLFVNAVALSAAVQAAPTGVRIGAQNCYHEPEGAFTGEISLGMLQAVGVQDVLVGHSERRHVFGEDDSLIGRKVQAALQAGFAVVLCVGETQAQREAGQTEAILQQQVELGLVPSRDLLPEAADRLVIAYEPVWAIGTGLTATPVGAGEAHGAVRAALEQVQTGLGDTVSVLYGGSVKPANAAELVAQPDIDGVLVGGASLAVASWCDIVKALSNS